MSLRDWQNMRKGNKKITYRNQELGNQSKLSLVANIYLFSCWENPIFYVQRLWYHPHFGHHHSRYLQVRGQQNTHRCLYIGEIASSWGTAWYLTRVSFLLPFSGRAPVILPLENLAAAPKQNQLAPPSLWNKCTAGSKRYNMPEKSSYWP